MKHDHELMRRAMAIWQQHDHVGSSDVTLRGFIGVFHAVMTAVREREQPTVHPVFAAAQRERMRLAAEEIERAVYDK